MNLELAEILGISAGAITNWKSSNSVNTDLLMKKLNLISPSWLFYGVGPMLLSDVDLLVKNDSSEGSVKQIGFNNDNSKNYGSDENSKAVIDELRENNEYLREQNKMLLEKLLEKK